MLDSVGNRVAARESVRGVLLYLPIVLRDAGAEELLRVPALPDTAPSSPLTTPDSPALTSPLATPTVPAAPLDGESRGEGLLQRLWGWLTEQLSAEGAAAAPLGEMALLSPLETPPAPCTSPAAEEGEEVTAYTYDARGRLTEAVTSAGRCYRYTYDAVGNRVVMTDTGGTTTYTYDAANRLTHVESAGSGADYTWDDRGNLTHDGAFTYTYDAAGRLVRAVSITATVQYTYTAEGLRTAQDVDGEVTTFAWDWATGVPELLSDDEALYLVGHDTLAWEDDGTWTYIVPDALGSVRQETNAHGAVVAVREWTPYGIELNAARDGLGYAGEWYDPNLGLQYLRARWYDAVSGRFAQKDPWYGSLERPQSQGGFSYVLNNPIRLVDPLGLCEDDPYDPYVDYDCWLIAYDIGAVYGSLDVFGQVGDEDLRGYYRQSFIRSNPDRPSLHRLSETPDQITQLWVGQPGAMDCGLTSLAMAIHLLQYRYHGIDNREVPPQQVINLAKAIPLSGYTPEGGNGPFTIGKVARALGWDVRFTAFNQKQDLVSAIDRDEVTLVAYGEMEYVESQSCYWSPPPIGGGCATTFALPMKLHWAHMMLLYAYSETTKDFGFLDPDQKWDKQIHWIPEQDFLPKWDGLLGQMWWIQ